MSETNKSSSTPEHTESSTEPSQADHQRVVEELVEQKQVPSATTAAAIPMGHASVATASTGNPAGRNLRALTIAMVACDSVALLCVLLTFAAAFFGWITLVGIIAASVISFIIPCVKKDRQLPDDVKKMCTGAFVSHLVTLVAWVAGIALAVAAVASSNSGLAVTAVVLTIMTIAGLITALSFAGVLLCKLNALSARHSN